MIQTFLSGEYLERQDPINHHIGTAKMGSTKEAGVVDKNLKIFDLENIYISSSAVFPTSSNVDVHHSCPVVKAGISPKETRFKKMFNHDVKKIKRIKLHLFDLKKRASLIELYDLYRDYLEQYYSNSQLSEEVFDTS